MAFIVVYDANVLARSLHEACQAQDTEDLGNFVNWCTFNAHDAA